MAMILPFVVLLLAAQTPAPVDPAAGERARLRVAVNCRIEADRLAIERTEPDLAGLVLNGDGPLSDGQLLCYGDALAGSDLYPSIGNEALSRRYDRLVRQAGHANARRFLRQLGLLSRAPRRLRGEPLEQFARRLERYCGVPRRSVLRAEGGRIMLAEATEAQASRENPRNWLCTYYAAVMAGYDPLTPQPPIPTPVPDVPLSAE